MLSKENKHAPTIKPKGSLQVTPAQLHILCFILCVTQPGSGEPLNHNRTNLTTWVGPIFNTFNSLCFRLYLAGSFLFLKSLI